MLLKALTSDWRLVILRQFLAFDELVENRGRQRAGPDDGRYCDLSFQSECK